MRIIQDGGFSCAMRSIVRSLLVILYCKVQFGEGYLVSSSRLWLKTTSRFSYDQPRILSASLDSNEMGIPDNDLNITSSLLANLPPTSTSVLEIGAAGIEVREEDFAQNRELDEILYERAKRFYDPTAINTQKEKCILVAVDRGSYVYSESLRQAEKSNRENEAKPQQLAFSLQESMSELSELVGTAGMVVCGAVVQKLSSPNMKTYLGTGKIEEIARYINHTEARTLVVDDDLSPKQQRNLEDAFVEYGLPDVKILDRTAIILEIFAQHAQSREGQLQVELAMLEYRLTRGPRSKGGDFDSGCGFRGPGESKLETDKRVIRDKIVQLKRELLTLGAQRQQHRKSR